MNRTPLPAAPMPPIVIPPQPLAIPPLKKPRARPPIENAFPSPHAQPLPCAVPHAAHLPPFSPSRPALFAALALSISALGVNCAQLDLTSSADAGTIAPLTTVSSVSPAAGKIAPDAIFQVTFSAPMDASLLLSDVARSETVVLVAQANAQVMTAALAHSRLTAAEEALMISAQATLGAQAETISLAPSSPLAAGSYALLIASRLKDSTEQKLAGDGFEFDYTVAVRAPPPALLDPVAGSSAPENLARVRVVFSEGAPGSLVSLAGPSGSIGAAAAPSAAGEVAIELCADAPCAALVAGQQYQLQLDGVAIPSASFTAASCTRDASPRLVNSVLTPGDTSAQLALSLDGPAHVLVEVAPAASADAGVSPSSTDAGSGAVSPSGDCDAGNCSESVSAFASCAATACSGDTSASCSAQLSIPSLVAATRYTAQIFLEDDEGHLAQLSPLQFTTLGAIPNASLEEVMASPPLPEPREEGEYVELENSGTAPIDLSQLALQGPDGTVRPLLAAVPPSPILLEPGGFALAVGASFDATRYSIPAGVPVLRASTQRLLGRGLADNAPPAITLLAVIPSSDAGPADLPLSNFGGGAFDCVEGASIDRVEPAPAAGQPLFACGKIGGSIGAFP